MDTKLSSMALNASRVKKPSDFLKDRVARAKNSPIQTTDETHTTTIVKLMPDKESVIKGCDVSLDRPLFHPEPSNVILQHYQAFKTYEIVINFRNMDKVRSSLD